MADQVEASHILIMHIDSERSSATRTKDEALTLTPIVPRQMMVDRWGPSGQVPWCRSLMKPYFRLKPAPAAIS